MHELSGKAAIITGASRGIGAATAATLSNLGVNVVLAARSESTIRHNAEILRDNGGQAEAVTCDVSNYKDVQALISHCESSFGRLDILINNAGVIEPIGHLATSNPDTWAHAADINFKGVYFGMRAALPAMMTQQSGVIINVGSGAAYSPLEGWSHYCASKAAAAMLTRCADKEAAASGIRVIGISPGTVATEMQVLIKASGINPVSQMDYSDHIEPELPARAIAWLCTSEAAEYAGKEVSLRDEAFQKQAGL
ncbi:short-chain dehydrogenase [Chromatiales bacterium (ex Bugula neritina AB1)]|nr:short-chain dehydrogenase [Chromatiales bacterium (ex Bugula neritina AB1)]